MTDKDLLNNPLSKILKSNVDKINSETKNQNAHDVLPTNVELKGAVSTSTAERNETDDKQSSDKEKKGMNKTRTEGTPPGETKKTVKKVFLFESLVKTMHRGEVPALLAEHLLRGIPHRGISVERICVPLIALIGNKMIKNGKVVDREMVKLLSGCRNLSSVGKIKTYDSSQHEQLLTHLSFI
uniref:DNA_ligase_A_N domain-containing protein n=1 Tax=Strongyloides papillosus TaxID=174720 RepID=A0A0N5C7N3_STREA